MAKCIQISRTWFTVWGALLSYSIACAETRQSQSQTHHSFKQHSWMQFLASNRKTIDFRPWIDQLGASAVTSFRNIERVGTFVNINEVVRDPAIPDISWFCDYNVPVWYHWNQKHAESPALVHLGPLLYQFDELVSSDIPRSPSPPLLQPSSPPTFNNAMDIGPSVNVGGDTTEMEAFFQQRKERNKRICQRETLTERQKRENRERQPPTASSVVILWSHTCTGEYKSSKIMGKQQRLEHLDSYSENQKCYDAFHNEWHICHLWAGDNDQNLQLPDGFSPFADSEFEWSPRSPLPRRFQLPTASQAQSPELPTSLPQSKTPHRNEDDNDNDGISLGSEDDEAGKRLEEFLEDDAWCPPSQNQMDLVTVSTPTTIFANSLSRIVQLAENEILDILKTYFGYTLPTSLAAPPVINATTTTTTAADVTARKMFCRAVGIPWRYVAGVQDLFERPKVCAAMDFFVRLSKNQPLEVNECDFKPGNKEFLLSCPFFKHLRRVKTTANEFIYLFNIGPAMSTKWILGLRHASDAMMVLRVAADLNEYEIVEHLLVNGIPFHTFQASSSLQHTPLLV